MDEDTPDAIMRKAADAGKKLAEHFIAQDISGPTLMELEEQNPDRYFIILDQKDRRREQIVEEFEEAEPVSDELKEKIEEAFNRAFREKMFQ